MTYQYKSPSDTMFEYICNYIQDNGYPPSQAEIGEHCQLTKPQVEDHFHALHEQGRIITTPGKERSIRIVA